ncbi:MAG: DUF4920 domain-containing protein [Ignavibacteriales bacterium]|nr:MAG: DUF4920 domain-containing protein [Ignavibacteriales bacterium]
MDCINGAVLLTLQPSIIKHNGVLMKRLIVLVFLLAITFVKAEDQKYGKAITLKEKTSISKILSSPDKFDGKVVLVEGKILGVCEDKGCWIEIAGTKKNEKIKVKVEDGVIVFPKDSKGKTALVEGIVSQVDPKAVCDETKESKTQDAKATKEMKGKKDGGCCADKSKDAKDSKGKNCCADQKVAKVYQIQGNGAVIR